MTDPAPADLKITQATLPMGVNGMTQPQGDDSCSGTNEINRGRRQDQTETGKYASLPFYLAYLGYLSWTWADFAVLEVPQTLIQELHKVPH